MDCPWCKGGPGGHEATCQVYSRNWKSSLATQREVTRLLRERETRWGTPIKPTYTPKVPTSEPSKPSKPPDTRSDVQKRFAAIAEELESSDD